MSPAVNETLPFDENEYSVFGPSETLAILQVCVHMYICMNVHVHVHVHECTCACTCACACACIYAYMLILISWYQWRI